MVRNAICPMKGPAWIVPTVPCSLYSIHLVHKPPMALKCPQPKTVSSTVFPFHIAFPLFLCHASCLSISFKYAFFFGHTLRHLKKMTIPDHLTCLLRNLYVGQQAIVKITHGIMNCFQIGKGVCLDIVILLI